MDEQIELARRISFAEFKRATHHKSVEFSWIPANGTGKKEFKTKKFYCNKDSRIKMLSMPYFMLDSEAVFYKADEFNYRARSQFGITLFRVLQEAN